MGFFVYVHTCKVNGKRYVGITQQRSAERRWRPDGSGYNNCPRFWNAIQKYGWDNFDHEIIAEDLTEEIACSWEISLIALYRSNQPKYGYNIAEGGKYSKLSPETRKKLSEQMKGKYCGKKNPNYGNHKLAGKNNPRYGTHLSEDARRRISKANKGRKLGPFTEEHKRKMKENHRGGSEKRMVQCVETGKSYESINAAAREMNINKKMISNCCHGVAHYNTAGGYHWQFV